jgi:hypothetical protein
MLAKQATANRASTNRQRRQKMKPRKIKTRIEINLLALFALAGMGQRSPLEIPQAKAIQQNAR